LVIAKVTVYIDRELEKAIRIAAIEDEKKFGKWVSEAFQEKLDRRKRVDKETKPKK
jgi:predicted HicB family RNase H-like nuclease